MNNYIVNSIARVDTLAFDLFSLFIMIENEKLFPCTDLVFINIYTLPVKENDCASSACTSITITTKQMKISSDSSYHHYEIHDFL